MPMMLRLDEMLEAADESGMPGAEDFTKAAEGLATVLALALAQHLKIKSEPATMEHGGLCAPFFASRKGQPCPPAFERHDDPSEWQTRAEYDAAIRKSLARHRAR